MIKYSLTDELKQIPEYEKFENRKQFLNHACRHSKKVYTMAKQMTHLQRVQFQKEIQNGFDRNENHDDDSCIPALPNQGRGSYSL